LRPVRICMPFSVSHPALQLALQEQGYKEPTPVQAAVLEARAFDQDLLVSAQTGSGKTVAFGLAAASTLLGDDERMGRAGPPLALAIAPTRELAIQVSRELTWLYGKAGAVVVSCVGGMDARREQRLLANGCHIVVGTPGRLRDHIERGHLDLSGLKVAVLDEADEMLDLGFREDLEFILDAAPTERRTLLFSATIAKDIASLARRFQRDAVRIDTTSLNEPHRDIEYRVISVAPNEVERAVVNVLRHIDAPGALVFCSTRETVRRLYASLRERGFDVVTLSGELSQRERSDALQALRDGRARVCVATDVAARGLDLPDLGLVIHADLPVNRAGLLHRSGRTGRAGRKGVSVLLAPYQRRRRVEQILSSANIEAVWSGPPTAEDIRAGDMKRLLEDPTLTETGTEEEVALATAILATRTPMEIATALIRMRQAALPAPEDMFDDPRASLAPPSRTSQDRGSDRGNDRDRGQDRGFDRDGGRPERLAPEDVVWFRLSTGRQNNADPKWLIPLICRAGHVTKKDIGQIKIFDRETKFEITKEAEQRFTAAIKAAAESGQDQDMRIEPAVAPAGARAGGGGGRDHGPRGGAPRGASPRDSGARDVAPRQYAPRPAPKRDFVPRESAPRDFAPRDSAPRDAAPRDAAPRSKPFVPRDAAPRSEGEAPARKAYSKPAAQAKPAREWNPIDGAAEGTGPRPARPFNPDKKPAFGAKPPFEKKASYDKRPTPGEGKPFFPKKPKSKKGKPNG
jgi:ATP-dependent RNA helicase DeaD